MKWKTKVLNIPYFLLFTTEEEKEEWEQFHIFRTRIKCYSKSYNVVIDDVKPY